MQAAPRSKPETANPPTAATERALVNGIDVGRGRGPSRDHPDADRARGRGRGTLPRSGYHASQDGGRHSHRADCARRLDGASVCRPAGQVEAARALLDGGADINEQDSDGNNALVLAILNSHYDLAQLLIDRGANPDVAAKNGRAALYTAVEMHDEDWSPRPARRTGDQTSCMAIIRALIGHGANVNARLTAPAPIAKLAQDAGDKTLAAGATPFMRAARSADLELMRFLLEKGADPKLANKDGLNALMLASGLTWNDHIRGTEAQALDAAKPCASLGLDVNAATDKGETALHGAAGRGADSIVRFLVDKGAHVSARDKKGLTPLDIAMGKGGAPGVVKDRHETTAALIRRLGGTPGQEVKQTAELN